MTASMQQTSGIHPQLVADTHVIGQFERCCLLLHKNADIPWFIIVPVTDSEDFLSLEADFRNALLQTSAEVAALITAEFGFSKINFASIGNVVSQLHLHIVGRQQGDVVWPAPVWGNLTSGSGYTKERVENIKRAALMHVSASARAQ